MEPYYPFKNSSVEDLTIGEENCEGRASGYCNGPLKSGTTYKVKIRSFTTPDKFTDTHYSFPIQTGMLHGKRLFLCLVFRTDRKKQRMSFVSLKSDGVVILSSKFFLFK